MNNQLQVFENEEFGKVRVLEIDGQPWFVGKDVTDILGYGNGSRDINRHVDAEMVQQTIELHCTHAIILGDDADRYHAAAHENGVAVASLGYKSLHLFQQGSGFALFDLQLAQKLESELLTFDGILQHSVCKIGSVLADGGKHLGSDPALEPLGRWELAG